MSANQANDPYPLFRWVFGTGVSLLLFAAGAWGLFFYLQTSPPAAQNLSAPVEDFEASDLKGKVLKLSSFQGQVVVVHFWATWCGPCFPEMITLNKLAAKFKGRLVVWAMSEESPEEISSFLKSFGELSPYFLPASVEKKETNRFFAVQAVPETFVFNPRGRFVEKHTGPRDWVSDKYIKKLQNLLP